MESLVKACIFGVLLVCRISYASVDIIWDYSYDTRNYFNDDRKYIMEQVAYAFESRLGGETFGSMDPGDYATTYTPYVSLAILPPALPPR